MKEKRKAKISWNEKEKSVDLQLYCWDNETKEYYWGLSKRYRTKELTEDNSWLSIDILAEIENLKNLNYEIEIKGF